VADVSTPGTSNAGVAITGDDAAIVANQNHLRSMIHPNFWKGNDG
jgi:hypothetical protein